MGGPCSASQNTSHDVCRGSFSSLALIPFRRPLLPNAGVTNNVTNCNNRPSTTRDLTADEYDQLSTSPPAIGKYNPPYPNNYEVPPIEDTYRPTKRLR